MGGNSQEQVCMDVEEQVRVFFHPFRSHNRVKQEEYPKFCTSACKVCLDMCTVWQCKGVFLILPLEHSGDRYL